MSERQLLAKYLKEREALVASAAVTAARLTALDDVIRSLRVVLGEVPATVASSRRSAQATGTKALILDVLAKSADRLSLKALATACKVAPSALPYHLTPLLETGDIDRQGKSRATTYGIPR